jgi:hypothetical protein
MGQALSSTRLSHLIAAHAPLSQACCNNFGQDGDCDGGVPTICDTRCADRFIPFWQSCSGFLGGDGDGDLSNDGGGRGGGGRGSGHRRQLQVVAHTDMSAFAAKCIAAHNANLVHDTDQDTPGLQHDMGERLKTSVACGGHDMKTTGDLNTDSGAFDGLWMLGVSGDSLCMHQACPGCSGGWLTTAERDACPALVNKRAVMDGLAQAFPGGECSLLSPIPGCGFSLDTNGDGDGGGGPPPPPPPPLHLHGAT